MSRVGEEAQAESICSRRSSVLNSSHRSLASLREEFPVTAAKEEGLLKSWGVVQGDWTVVLYGCDEEKPHDQVHGRPPAVQPRINVQC